MGRLTQLLQACVRNRKGWGGCDGLVGVITVAAAMIPDIIRCTFGLNRPRHCQPMQSLGGSRLSSTGSSAHVEDDANENLKQNRAKSSYDQ